MRPYFSAGVALCVGLVVTALVTREVKKSIEDDAISQFSFASDQATLKIRERLNTYDLILKGGAGLFAGSDEVTRSSWRAYTERLQVEDSIAGVLSIGYSAVIQPDHLNAYITQVRADGFPEFTVWPPGGRDLFSAIIYLEPFTGRNLRAFGFDMLSEPVRRAAMEQARDGGEASLSGKVLLVQEASKDVQSGTLMYVPVYRHGAILNTVEQRREALIGWSYSPYRMNDLMLGMLSGWKDSQGKFVHLYIYDGVKKASEALLFDSDPKQSLRQRSILFQQRQIDFGGRTWLLEFDVIKGVANINYGSVWGAFISGIALSSLLFWLILSLTRTQARALEIANALTEEMRNQEDVTEYQNAQSKLRIAASVFETSREGIMITEVDGSIIDVNDSFSRITGYSKEEIIGQNPRILKSGLQNVDYYAAMWRDLKAKGHWYGEIWNRRKNGEVYAEMQTITTVSDPKGGSDRHVSLFSDITLIKEHEKQLEHIAHFDALTGLPNRVLLADRLHQAMSQAKRREQKLAVAFLDLDGFKAINDTYGHEAGDQLLIVVATRMKEILREGDTLSRIGGDEFVAVLVDFDNFEESLPLLNRLLTAAAEPVQYGYARFQVSASLGVTFFPQQEKIDADQLQRQADQAMYQAKQAGKNRYHVFDAERDRSIRGHHDSMERIRLALNENEFTLYYQPKVNMRTGKVIGTEALIRWQHPQNGLLAPAAFLPVIEGNELAVSIGEWVIETALTQMETWHAEGLDIPVSVNVGARQLQQSDFVERLCSILAKHPEVQAGCLRLEVLETSALEDMTQVSEVIEACAQMGVLFALDDFGTGYSSLTYLKRLAVAELKIDQSFVRGMLDDHDDLAILEGVIGLANAFLREVIAEGVETVEHGEMLLQLGCEMAQGYGIAHPMPADQLPGWSLSWEPPLSWVNAFKVKHEDLPLLYAMVEHRAWIEALKCYFEGRQVAPPPMNHHQCRFGALMDRMLQNDPIIKGGFSHIDPLHRKVHGLAAELCELKESGQIVEVMSRMDEFFSLRDELLDYLRKEFTRR